LKIKSSLCIKGIRILKFLARSHEYLEWLVALRLQASLPDGFKLVKQVAETADIIANTVTMVVLLEKVNNALIVEERAVIVPKQI